jgi:hypothetical protein
MILRAPISEVSRLLHRKRLRIDPQYRGECLRLFADPRARMAYFSKRGLTVDDFAEAIWDAGFCDPRPDCTEVLDMLENLILSTPGVVRAKVAKSEIRATLGDLESSLERELETRRKNRWRSWECSCANSAKIRTTKDELPPAMARALCDECGEPWTLKTIKLDLSNRYVPMSAEECAF